MASGVYRIVHTPTGKLYIGSAANIATRWGQHRHMLRYGKHHSTYLQRAWNKYGEQDFAFELIEEITPDKCVEREQYWIDTLHPGYNVYPLAVSPLGYRHSEKAKAKLSALARGRPSPMKGRHHTQATRAKISEAKAGKPNIKQQGKIISPEQRAKISAARTGKHLSEEHRLAISIAQKGVKKPEGMGDKVRKTLTGQPHTAARREKNRVSHLGQVPHNKGKKMPPEARANVLAAQQARRAKERAAKAAKLMQGQSLEDI